MNLANERRKVVRAIRRLVEPHFRDSSYVTRVDPTKCRFAPGNRRPVRMWAPDQSWVDLRGCFKLTGFAAITEFGPIVDVSGGGMIWEAYSEFPLEDLLKLRAWAERTFMEKAA